MLLIQTNMEPIDSDGISGIPGRKAVFYFAWGGQMEFFGNVDWRELLQTYGYWAILLGTFLEGETIVILAGMLVMADQLSFEGVAVCAFLGTFASDQLMFSLGKYKGTAILARFPKLERKRERVSRLMQKYDLLLILGFRFIYGIRNVTPIVLGLSNICHRRFFVLNLAGALAWAVLFTVAGYYSGHLIDKILRIFGLSVFFGILGAALLAAIVFYFVRRRKGATETPPPTPPAAE